MLIVSCLGSEEQLGALARFLRCPLAANAKSR